MLYSGVAAKGTWESTRLQTVVSIASSAARRNDYSGTTLRAPHLFDTTVHLAIQSAGSPTHYLFRHAEMHARKSSAAKSNSRPSRQRNSPWLRRKHMSVQSPERSHLHHHGCYRASCSSRLSNLRWLLSPGMRRSRRILEQTRSNGSNHCKRVLAWSRWGHILGKPPFANKGTLLFQL